MYLVVGTGRSGTTAVAQALEKCLGVDMGGPGRKSDSNPSGDYERTVAKKASLSYLRGFTSLEAWRRQVRVGLRGLTEPWGVKLPASAYMLDEWFLKYPTANVIWAQRDLEPTLRSYMKWYLFSERRARQEIGTRLHLLNYWLRDRDHLAIDFTDHRPMDEIVRLVTEKWPALRSPGVSP